MEEICDSVDAAFHWLEDEPSDLSGSLAVEIDDERRARSASRVRPPVRRGVRVAASHVVAPVPPALPARRPERSLNGLWVAALAVASAGLLTGFGVLLTGIVAAVAVLLS